MSGRVLGTAVRFRLRTACRKVALAPYQRDTAIRLVFFELTNPKLLHSHTDRSQKKARESCLAFLQGGEIGEVEADECSGGALRSTCVTRDGRTSASRGTLKYMRVMASNRSAPVVFEL